MSECHCESPRMHARAVEGAILMSLNLAFVERDREAHWRAHADKLERKFTTGHGRHYSHFLYGSEA